MKAEDRDPVDFLCDILDSIDKIGSFIEGLDFDEFAEDEKTVYAVTRALEIIGEETKNLPESLKKKHSEVPWRKMTGTRDKMIHGYCPARVPPREGGVLFTRFARSRGLAYKLK